MPVSRPAPPTHTRPQPRFSGASIDELHADKAGGGLDNRPHTIRGDQMETPERSEQDQRAIRELILNAFAALSPETRERVLFGGDEDADADADERDVA